jgi:hypothetical protein
MPKTVQEITLILKGRDKNGKPIVKPITVYA